jgi:hypothetical protein
MAVKGLLEAALKTGGKAVSDAIEKAKYDRSEFDPRFFPGKTVRVKDFPEKRPDVINTNTMIPYQRLALQDLVGRPYLTTMSDRIAAGGILEGIGNKPLAHPLRLTGGQDYMRENPGKVWASAENVVPDMEKAANELKAEFGQSPVYLPWRMTPSGGDFAHLTGQTMLSWAAANMPKAVKKQLDKDMKQLIPDWAGVDDPKSLLQYGNLKDTQRKAVMNMMDVNYRNQGGISQTQARLAVADQSQLLSPDSGFQNVGEIDLSRGTLAGEGNLTYPSALAGEYKGTLDTDVTAMDLNPQRYARKRKKDGTFDTGPQGPDYLSTREVPRRAMEVGYWGGLIDEPLLKSLSEKGFKVDSPAAVGLLSGAGALAALAPQEADASIAKLADRGMKLIDVVDPEDSRVGQYYLQKGDDTKSIGSVDTNYALDSGFGEGYMSSQNTEIAPEYRRQGIGREVYDAIEELSGNQLVPSTTLSPQGAAMWNSRDRGLLEQVQNRMGKDNYDTVEDVLYPEGRPDPNAVKLRGFDRAYAVPAAGLLTAAETAEPREYREAPVVQEQSFGDMVNEYAQINQRAQAAEAQKFDTLMREDARLRAMGSAAFGQVSPELAAYRRSQMLPTIGEIGMGALEGAVDTVDFVSQLPTAISTMTMPKRTPLRDRLGGLLDYSFVDERDQRARDQARLIGGLLSPI